MSAETAHDRLIVAIDANTLQLIGFEAYPPGVPEMNVDVTVADRRWTFAAMTAVPRDDGDSMAMPFPPVIYTPASDALPVPVGP